jgi:uncharacterized membrane protein
LKVLLWLYLSSGLLLCALSIPLILRRVPPNSVYGFRIPATLRDANLWYAVNRYAGRWLLGAGAAIVIAAALLYLVPGISLDHYALGELAVVVLGLGAAVTASVLYLLNLQRHSAGARDP